MNAAVIELHFLPSVPYFSLLFSYDEIIFERFEHYVKQSFRNRCYINTAAGREILIVPLTEKHGKVVITSVRIDYSQKWLNRTWRTIQSSYGKAPFFEYYAEELHAVLFKKITFLYDLNIELLSLCLKWLRQTVIIKETTHYEKNVQPPFYDLRNVLTGKNEPSEVINYKPVSYQQVFGSNFVPDLSLLDLICCVGPEAMDVIRGSTMRE
jgi:hypothetical protein